MQTRQPVWRRVATLYVFIACALAALVSPSTALQESGFYTCPPCGCAGDTEKHAEAGSCATCGMLMVFRSHDIKQVTEVERIPSQNTTRRNVAILVFPGVQIIDFTAPYEVFGQAGFQVYTVAETAAEITTSMGLKVTPSYTLSNCPKPDIVVLPGGGGVGAVRQSQAVMDWIRAQEKATESILTVCNGAFILAETGLLDGREATTFYGLIPTLAAQAPEVRVVSDRRYVDNGKFITTAGLSSGIDGSLHVVNKLLGKASAQRIALNMEYNWLDDVSYARADFADRMLLDQVILSGRHLPYLDAPGTTWRVVSTQGNAAEWQVEWQVEGGVDASELMTLFERKLTTDARWNRTDARRSGAAHVTRWMFVDERERAWSGLLHVEPHGNALVVRLEIQRNQHTG